MVGKSLISINDYSKEEYLHILDLTAEFEDNPNQDLLLGYVVATLFFENGAIAVVDNFFCIPDNSSKNVLELYGSKGSILAKNTIGQGDSGEMVAFLEADDNGYDAQQERAEGEGIVIAPEPKNTYRAEIEDFSQAILQGREPANNAEIGLQSQKVLAACYESAATGKALDVG